MAKTIRSKGFYGHLDGSTTECDTTITFSGGAMSENLSLSFMGKNRITLPFRPIERLAEAVYDKARRSGRAIGGTYATIEEAGVVDGFFSNQQMLPTPGKVSVWFRSNGKVDMVTLSFEDSGQISVPFAPMASLLRSQRSNSV